MPPPASEGWRIVSMAASAAVRSTPVRWTTFASPSVIFFWASTISAQAYSVATGLAMICPGARSEALGFVKRRAP